MKLLIVYDDTVPKSEIITDIIGDRGFSDVVVKRRTLKNRFFSFIEREYPHAGFVLIHSAYEFNELSAELEKKYGGETKVLHFFSHHVLSDEEQFLLTLRKISFIEENCLLMARDVPVGVMSPDLAHYIQFVDDIMKEPALSSLAAARTIPAVIPVDGVIDIGKIEHFIQCITGNFDSRYFNSLEGDEYTIVKRSFNRKKIKAEYMFYHLLPEDMQIWFVEPFHYCETPEEASYTMERLHMTDLAIKWVHGSVDEEELKVILDKYFYFFQHRHSRDVSEQEYQRIADQLYVEKVRTRMEELKKFEAYSSIEKLLSMNGGATIDTIVSQYLHLKERVESRVHQKTVSVIGHGDPCFANTMYNKSTRTLKFIDPKGALKEEELWTNPYYDIAKLSHSICGRYDFFNNDLFEININSKFETELRIDFDNQKYIEIFRKKLQENGYDYLLTRVYEASLFLSMLPLHMDNPYKVYGFILNARNILKEIESNV